MVLSRQLERIWELIMRIGFISNTTGIVLYCTDVVSHHMHHDRAIYTSRETHDFLYLSSRFEKYFLKVFTDFLRIPFHHDGALLVNWPCFTSKNIITKESTDLH